MPRRFPIWERLSSQETIWGGGPSTSKETSCVALGGCFAKREAPSALAYFRVVHAGNTIVSDYLANLGCKKNKQSRQHVPHDPFDIPPLGTV